MAETRTQNVVRPLHFLCSVAFPRTPTTTSDLSVNNTPPTNDNMQQGVPAKRLFLSHKDMEQRVKNLDCKETLLTNSTFGEADVLGPRRPLEDPDGNIDEVRALGVVLWPAKGRVPIAL